MSYLPCSQHTQRQNCLSSTLGYCSSTASAIPPQQCCSSPSAVIFGGFLSRGAGAAKSSCHLCSTLMSVVTVFLQMRVQRGQADQPSVRAPHTRHGFHKVPPRISRSELQGVSICPCFYPESSCSARGIPQVPERMLSSHTSGGSTWPSLAPSPPLTKGLKSMVLEKGSQMKAVHINVLLIKRRGKAFHSHLRRCTHPQLSL